MSTLVERLRESARHRHACQITAIPPLPLEQFTDWLAADRIVTLEAENATLKADNADLRKEAQTARELMYSVTEQRDKLEDLFAAAAAGRAEAEAERDADRRAFHDSQWRKLREITAERDRLRQALISIRTFVLGPAMGPPSAIERHIAGMVDAALAPLPSAG